MTKRCRPSSTSTSERSLRTYQRHSLSNADCEINSMPYDLLTEVLVQVASSSLTDLFNVKQTCKILSKVGDDSYIYRHASLENVPVVQWRLSNEMSSFLKRCEEHENGEALYRLGMREFFSNKHDDRGKELLAKAANGGHIVAAYALGMILLGTDDADETSKKHGIELLNKITKMRSKNVRQCRSKSKNILDQLWRNNVLIPQSQGICTCKRQKKKRGWESSDDEAEEEICSETCKWNHELTKFCNML